MGTLLAIFAFLKQVGPFIVELVDVVDANLPAGTPGKAKADLFDTLLHQAIADAGVVVPDLAKAKPYIQAAVDKILASKKDAQIAFAASKQTATTTAATS